MLLCHVTMREAWEAAQRQGRYAPPELARDGFLHCCRPEQLAFVKARHFAGRTAGMLVLHIDTRRLERGAECGDPLRWVTSEPGLPPFPHLHADVPLAAVTEVTSLMP